MIELPFVPGPGRTELSRSLFVVTPGKSVFMSFVNPESDFSVTQFAPFHHSMTALWIFRPATVVHGEPSTFGVSM